MFVNKSRVIVENTCISTNRAVELYTRKNPKNGSFTEKMWINEELYTSLSTNEPQLWISW